MATMMPGVYTPWRCGGRGNLTRFDVTRQTRRREYRHLDLAGEPVIERAETLAESTLEVSCCWCGRADAIDVVDRRDSTGDPSP